MRARDTLFFVFDLVLPDRAVQALENIVQNRKSPQRREYPASAPRSLKPRLQTLLEDIDAKQHGGLTFGLDTFEQLARSVELALSNIGSIDPDTEKNIAGAVLNAAAMGERNAERLAALALDHYNKEMATSVASLPGLATNEKSA